MGVPGPSPSQKRRIQTFRNIQTGKIFRKLVRPPKRVIRFRPDKRLIQKGPFPLPPPTPASIQKRVELDRLLTQLGFASPTLSDIQSLLAAVDDDRHQPDPKNLDRLLARLRELVKRGRKFRKIYILCGAVSDLIGIR